MKPCHTKDTIDEKANEVNVTSTENKVDLVDQGGEHAFSKFKKLTKKAGISQEIEDAGNVTIFSPMNKDFDKVTTKFEDVDLPTLRKWMLKHFVKGFLFRKDLEFGSVPVSSKSFFY